MRAWRRRRCEHNDLDLDACTLLIGCSDCHRTGLELQSCLSHLIEILPVLNAKEDDDAETDA